MAFRQLFERPQSWAEQQEQYVRERPCWGQQMSKDYATDVSLAEAFPLGAVQSLSGNNFKRVCM